MSQDTSDRTLGSPTLRSDKALSCLECLEIEAAVVKRYHFGARHALALLLAIILSLAVVSTMLARNVFTEDRGWLEAKQNLPRQEELARGVDEILWPETPSETDNRDGEPRASDAKSWGAQDVKDLWKKDGDLVTRARDLIVGAGRMVERNAVNRAFAELDQDDLGQVRTFIAAYGSNPYAQQEGYVQGLERRVLEERLYRAEEIVACGECWCWESQPSHAGPAVPTQ